ncbi:DUF2309 domain-containing protein [Marisediminicola antarctica]|uniref:DUF2309 domain-containing protein n=1 Tax=Marisediminicola antarctica TaxID=674079 RepID=UPI00137B7B09|nr:DUF2309 domain-containing protein [Marisediminicola antarctica]
MSLLLRVAVASAAHDIVPAWPLDSFIAVNPLAGSESLPFESAQSLGALTRHRTDYVADRKRGRILLTDLEAAVRLRIPELTGTVTIGGSTLPAARLAALELEQDQSHATAAGPRAPTLSRLDEITSRWVAAYLAPDSPWPMPHKDRGLYPAWRTLIGHDPSLAPGERRRLRGLPEDPDAGLAWALEQLGVEADDVQRVLARELHQLPGWASHIKWRAEKVGDIDLTSFLAVRFGTRHALQIPPSLDSTPHEHNPAAELRGRAELLAGHLVVENVTPADTSTVSRVLAAHPTRDHLFTWQLAYELNYRRRLLSSLSTEPAPTERPQIQVVMCIDPRSEGARRHLETASTIETFGFAGFFGVPIRFVRHSGKGAINSLPALLTPRHTVTEAPHDHATATRRVAAARRRDAVHAALHAGESGTATSFAFAETAGWFYGLTSVLRTFAPGLLARIREAQLADNALESSVTVADAFTLEERAVLAEASLRMMGMARFGQLVVLAGHGSDSRNNLYQSALDCGACGGNPGAANARAAALIFNDAGVRELLDARGIRIPNDTVFVAAEHNTVTDAITLLDTHSLPASHRALADDFIRQQIPAADRLVRERARDLPGASPRHSATRLRRRAHDWAEVYPELGLAGNAAMIIGPRELTRGVDLSRRVFLHSYLPELDPDGTGLETILTAPVVVAQWINHQYYFSSINPDLHGAGTKTVHNAIGTIGVITGQGGDLRRGLPWQSVGVGTALLHEPLRLAVIVQAPLDTIGQIISRNQVLRDLFDNEWITITARGRTTDPWMQYTRYGWHTAPLPPAEGAQQ